MARGDPRDKPARRLNSRPPFQGAPINRFARSPEWARSLVSNADGRGEAGGGVGAADDDEDDEQYGNKTGDFRKLCYHHCVSQPASRAGGGRRRGVAMMSS